MEEFDFGLAEWDMGVLGDGFLEMLDMSHSMEQYTFDLYSGEYSYNTADWMVAGENTAGFDESLFSAPTRPESTSNTSSKHENTAPFDSSPISTNEAESLRVRDSSSVKFEDCLREFLVTQPLDKTSKRRRPYSSDRRKEVKNIRKAGACIRCKIMKMPCKLELPCSTCMKAGRSLSLGKAICVRQKLTDVRFTGDLWDQMADMTWLRDEVPVLEGPKRILNISLACFCDANSFLFNNDWESVIWATGGHDGPWTIAAPLQVEVQDFQPKMGSEQKHIVNVIDPKLRRSSLQASQICAIPESSLPTLERLEQWALDTARNHPRAFVGGIRGSFLSLARRYFECERPLPLKDLVRKAVRLTCLHGIWDSDLPIPRANGQQSHQFASHAVHRQISVIVAKGIVDAEADILSHLQKHVFGSKGPGRSNMLPIWTCLWLLILVYRHTIGCYAEDNIEKDRRELAQHMYNMLVSIYSALFRPSSPLWLNWLKEDVFNMFGRDWRITEAMGTLKTEIAHYGNNDDFAFTSKQDSLLHSLVFKHEEKLGKKLMEKRSFQDPLQSKSLLEYDPQCYLVEEAEIRPRRSSWGYEQNNRLLVVREASKGTNGFGWPPSFVDQQSKKKLSSYL